jgi:hypothetical protein
MEASVQLYVSGAKTPRKESQYPGGWEGPSDGSDAVKKENIFARSSSRSLVTIVTELPPAPMLYGYNNKKWLT